MMLRQAVMVAVVGLPMLWACASADPPGTGRNRPLTKSPGNGPGLIANIG